MRCGVPVGPVVGPQIEDPPSRVDTVGVLDAVTVAKALAGAYCAVESEGAVDLSPFHLRCV